MSPDFHDRFAATSEETPLGLQLLYSEPLDLDAEAVTTVLRAYHPDLAIATVDLTPSAGLLAWRNHAVKLLAFDAPMPYGPVETCVGPAMMDPELKAEAKAHAAHVLLLYAGTHPDPLERYVALAATAGALARFAASVVMNEEARAAAPAFDLVPDPEEDALATLRKLPIPYLWGGFVRMDVGDPERPWVRSFANHRLGLPELAYHLAGFHDTSRVFALFAGMLGYLRQTGERFVAGDTVDLGDGKLKLREPTEQEWYLESAATMLVVEQSPG